MKAPKESDIQKALLDWLRIHGAVAIRVNSGAFAGEYKGKKRFVKLNDTPGCSDILCCWQGRFLAVEVKRELPRTKNVALLSKAALRLATQQAFLNSITRAGGIGVMVTSVAELAAHLTNVGLEP